MVLGMIDADRCTECQYVKNGEIQPEDTADCPLCWKLSKFEILKSIEKSEKRKKNGQKRIQ